MGEIYKLFLDESGVPDPAIIKNNPFFSLCGIIVNEQSAHHLKIRSDQIKYRYWKTTDVVLHSYEISRKINRFAILNDPSVCKEFYADIQNFIRTGGIRCIAVSVNKKTALSCSMNTKDIYEQANDEILKSFIKFLHDKKSTGQIVVESSGGQKDILLYKRYIHYLSNGLPSLGLDHNAVKNLLTSFSLVSKNNYDIETQIADLFAHPIILLCKIDDGLLSLLPATNDFKMCQILKSKLIHGTNIIKLPICPPPITGQQIALSLPAISSKSAPLGGGVIS